jgi:hypothetical protein
MLSPEALVMLAVVLAWILRVLIGLVSRAAVA